MQSHDRSAISACARAGAHKAARCTRVVHHMCNASHAAFAGGPIQVLHEHTLILQGLMTESAHDSKSVM